MLPLKEGDFVILKSGGLCRITEVAERESAGRLETEYELTGDTFHEFIFADELEPQIRPPVTKDQATAILAGLKTGEPPEGKAQAWGFSKSEAQRVLQSNNIELQSNYLRGLWNSQTEGWIKKELTERLERLIVPELAHSLGIKIEDIKADLKAVPSMVAPPPPPVAAPKEVPTAPTAVPTAEIKIIEDLGPKLVGVLNIDKDIVIGDVSKLLPDEKGPNYSRGRLPAFFCPAESGDWYVFASPEEQDKAISREILLLHRNAMPHFGKIEDDARCVADLNIASRNVGVVAAETSEDPAFVEKLQNTPKNTILDGKACRIPVEDSDGHCNLFVFAKNRKAVYLQLVC